MQPTGTLSKRIPDYVHTNALVVFWLHDYGLNRIARTNHPHGYEVLM